MAIAIRKDAAAGTMKDLVKRYQEQGRPYITMTCLVANCGGEYIIYHEATTEQGQATPPHDKATTCANGAATLWLKRGKDMIKATLWSGTTSL